MSRDSWANFLSQRWQNFEGADNDQNNKPTVLKPAFSPILKTYKFFFLCTVFDKLDLSPRLIDLGKDDSKGCFVSWN